MSDTRNLTTDNSQNRPLPSWMTKSPNSNSPKENFNGLNTVQYIKFPGKIILERNFLGVAGYCRELLEIVDKSPDAFISIAFDMEWPWSYVTGSKKTALIQLCLDTGTCYLFQVYNYLRLPNSLVQLLEHAKVRLNGNRVENDIRKLARDFPANKLKTDLILRNCIDLGRYYNQVFRDDRSWSLAVLTKLLLGLDMNKDKSVRASQWDEPNLSKEQCIYAATDVYASQLIYETIRREEEKQNWKLTRPLTSPEKPGSRVKNFNDFLVERAVTEKSLDDKRNDDGTLTEN